MLQAVPGHEQVRVRHGLEGVNLVLCHRQRSQHCQCTFLVSFQHRSVDDAVPQARCQACLQGKEEVRAMLVSDI